VEVGAAFEDGDEATAGGFLGETAEAAGHNRNTCGRHVEAAEGVAAIAVEAGRHQPELRGALAEVRVDDLVEGAGELGIPETGGERQVERAPNTGADAHLRRRARAGIE